MFLGRVVQVGEPLWTQHDANAVLAYFKEKSFACSGCGHPREETMDPRRDGKYLARPLRCFACQARDRSQREFGTRPSDSDGLYFAVEPL